MSVVRHGDGGPPLSAVRPLRRKRHARLSISAADASVPSTPPPSTPPRVYTLNKARRGVARETLVQRSPQPGERNGTTHDDIMELLRAAQLPAQVLSVVETHRAAFGPVSTSAALHRLARLSRDATVDAASLVTLNRLQDEFVTAFRPRNLANTLWAYASLRQAPSAAWLTSFVGSCSRDVAFDPQQTSNSLWALATLVTEGLVAREAVAPALQPLARQAGRHAAARSLLPQHVSNVFWSLGKLSHEPGEAVQAQLCAAAAQVRDSLLPQHFSNILWGMAALRGSRASPLSAPERALLAQLATASLPHLPAFSPAELSAALWAFSSLAVSPGSAWLRAHEAAGQEGLARGSARAVSTTLLAWSRLRYSPRRAAWYGTCLRARLRDATPQAVANSLAAFGTFAVTSRQSAQAGPAAAAAAEEGEGGGVRDSTLLALSAWSGKRLGAFKPTELAQTLWGMAVLGYDPGCEWRRALTAQSGRLPQFSLPELSSTLWGFACLGASPGRAWMTRWVACARAAGWAFAPRHVSAALWALAVLYQLGEGEGEGEEGGETWKELLDSAQAACWARLRADAESAMGGSAELGGQAQAKACAQFLSPVSWCTLLQAAMLLSPPGEAGGSLLAATEAAFPLPAPCWRHAAACWRRQARRTAASSLQQEVAGALWTGLGVPHEEERDAGEGLQRIDIAIEPPGRAVRVALEVDGPRHFCRGAVGGKAPPRGATLLRNQLLRRLGWRLVVLPYSSWPGGFDARVELLRGLLEPAMKGR